jgi:hypothetical protein
MSYQAAPGLMQPLHRSGCSENSEPFASDVVDGTQRIGGQSVFDTGDSLQRTS